MRRVPLFAAGNPQKVFFELRMDTPLVRSAEKARIPLADYQAELRTDASYDYNTRAVGAAWQLVIAGTEGPIREAKRRYGKGPVFAEMTAIALGLADARSRGLTRLVVRTDSQWSAAALLGLVTPQVHYMVKASKPALEIAATLETLAVVHTRTKSIRLIDKKARKASDKEAARIDVLESQRQARALAAFGRARNVTLRREGVVWIADGHARVTFDPPSCTCEGWSLRWARVPIEGKRSKRIPCKHLAAVALQEGITEPAALLQLARRALD
jgi:ribonuclease HI